MDIVAEAVGACEQAERRLAELIGAGAQLKRYSEVTRLVQLADGLGRLRAELLQDEVSATDQGQSADGSESPAAKPRGPSSRTRTKSGRAADYPRFLRDVDRLVKVGWSKRNRSEYEHKAPKIVVEAFCRSLADRVDHKKPFAMGELLPALDDEGHEIPDYQAYMILAWLRVRGVVQKKSRDEYLLLDTGKLRAGLAGEWDSTPTRESHVES